ncbi:hypothetical protein [Pseudomonas sp. 910_23]|uniref:hypothetical protein n=1 Tax=Pseudomonas sp. 910_23 TaxID=2604461 RepID=UPI0040639A2B
MPAMNTRTTSIEPMLGMIDAGRGVRMGGGAGGGAGFVMMQRAHLPQAVPSRQSPRQTVLL